MRHQALIDLSQAPTLDAFRGGLVTFAHELEFGLVSAAVVVDRAGADAAFFTLTNAPQAHQQAFHDKGRSKRDPVLRRLKRSSVPFSYDQALYVRDGAGDLWEEQAPHGYRTGVSVALHLPDHLHFLLGVDREAPLPKDDTELTALLAHLQLLAVHAQHAAITLLKPPDAVKPLPRLTPRETECLRWTFAGKTSWEISRILGISESGVSFHITRILKKFDCTSKHQAVLLALRHGLL